MNFPDVPFDEKLFDSNELLRSYWDRATDSKSYELPENFLESEDLRNMTDETYSMDQEEAVEAVEAVEVVEVVHAKTEEEKSDLVFEKAAEDPLLVTVNIPVVADDKNSKWVITAFVFIFLLCFIVSKLERY